MASPVWKNNEPIMMNMGTGPNVKVVISAVELSTAVASPENPPMKIRVPTMLVVMKVIATGMPHIIRTTTMPTKIMKAQYHSMPRHFP